jgi:hypothetical protein
MLRGNLCEESVVEFCFQSTVKQFLLDGMDSLR